MRNRNRNTKKEKELDRQRSKQAFRNYISKFTFEEKWDYFMERNAYVQLDFGDICGVVSEEYPLWQCVGSDADDLERYGFNLDDMEIISLSDCTEIKYIDGVPYTLDKKPGVVKIGYRPKGTDFPYAWYGYYVSEDGMESEAEKEDKFRAEIDKYYTAPYTNWDMYPDEQWIEHSDMIYEYMYKGFDLNYYLNCLEIGNLTVETSDPDVMSVWKCKNGKLVNIDTGEKKNSDYDTIEDRYVCFPTDVKETGKTKVDITLSMKGSKKKKIIHITLIDDSPAMDDGPQFEWGTIIVA